MRDPVPTIYVVPFESLPKSLQDLPESHKQQINDTLANDQVSTDEEIVEFWTQECEIPSEPANLAIAYRRQALTTLFFHLFEPRHLVIPFGAME